MVGAYAATKKSVERFGLVILMCDDKVKGVFPIFFFFLSFSFLFFFSIQRPPFFLDVWHSVVLSRTSLSFFFLSFSWVYIVLYMYITFIRA